MAKKDKKGKKKLTLYFDNEADMQKVQKVAESMGAYVAAPSGISDGHKMSQLLEQIANRNSLGNAIPDPETWQKEMRKDRKLPFRD
ncbi:hypothetical protein AB9P05_24795 [Roseivirga sp. BDSF3-8]|uniref:hypothetical protein n=1 Tax=Roseivirga sp. BDSF3-8 TaxID=3241598 RepID=UPI0035325827